MKTAILRFTACVIAGVLAFFAGVTTENQDRNSSINYERQMELQADAVFANEKLMASFDKGVYGECIFPDDFCGCWIEERSLVLALTSVDESVVCKYRDRIGDQFYCVKLVQREYSYNYLYSFAEAVSEEIQTEYESAFQCCYVRESENLAYVGVLEEYLPEITIKYGEGPIRIVESDLGKQHWTGLEGGYCVRDDTTATYYTLGVCGKKANVDSFVTAGHGVSTGDSFRLAGCLNAIGTASFVRYSNNNYGDFSIVSISNSGDYYPTSTIGSYYVTDYLANPSEGTILRFLGSSTNGSGYGAVTVRNLTIAYGSVNLKGMTAMLASSGITVAGDSGCPYFYNPQGSYNAHFAGVHCGEKIIDGFWQQIFTPYQYMSYVGFDLEYCEE